MTIQPTHTLRWNTSEWLLINKERNNVQKPVPVLRFPGQSFVASANALLQFDPSASTEGSRNLRVASTAAEPACPRWGWNSVLTVLSFRTGFATSFPAGRERFSPVKVTITRTMTHLQSSERGAKASRSPVDCCTLLRLRKQN